ncbi:MAG: putative quinol monooxygenase [Corynebacterium sp.]|nr:putative quinol monooxygenase [Corynebacterium sp.]
MSLTMILSYTGAPGAAQAFAKEMRENGIISTTRNRDGNLRYEFFQPLDTPDTIVLIDTWDNQAALDAHHESKLMSDIAALREKYDLHMQAQRYHGPLSLDASDHAHIRA